MDQDLSDTPALASRQYGDLVEQDMARRSPDVAGSTDDVTRLIHGDQ